MRFQKAVRGQSIVEFALVSIVLFMFLLGIIELARLMFVVSMVSNAAQEGSRYGIVRPRDILTGPAATQTAAAGGPIFIDKQVVADGACNVVDKTKDKVWGVPRSAINISVWYDNGSGTPVVPNTRTPVPYDTEIMQKGNRVVVEASYNFKFITPLLDVFARNGLDIKIRSARTILNNGATDSVPCRVSLTPAPQPTTAPTATPTDVPLPTLPPLLTATATRTPTVGPTPTPILQVLRITRVLALKRSGNNRPLGLVVDVVNGAGVPYPSASVRADVYVNGTLYVGGVPVGWLNAGTYRECVVTTHRSGDTITVDVFASAPGFIGDSRRGVVVQIGQVSCP
jgi:Flp pilus assembly protein TadG